MKTYQNFEEIIISPGLMVLTRTQCTQFTSPPSWRGRQLFRWLNCFRWLMIILYSSSSHRSQVRLKIKSWWFTKLYPTHDWAAARKCQRIYFYPSFQGKHEYQARQEAEDEETAKSWHSAFNGIYFSFSQDKSAVYQELWNISAPHLTHLLTENLNHILLFHYCSDRCRPGENRVRMHQAITEMI